MGFPQLEIRRRPYMRYIHDPSGLFKLSLVQYRLRALANPTTVGTQLEEEGFVNLSTGSEVGARRVARFSRRGLD